MRVLSVNISDTSLGIWQDDPNDPSFQREVYGGLIRQMRDRGWKIGPDPEVARRHKCISSMYRLGKTGDLRMEMKVSGRVVELAIWAVTWPLDNRNGPRYDFNKRDRMQYLDQLRVDLEFRRIVAWLRGLATVTVKDRNLEGSRPSLTGLPAVEWIGRRYAESWHSDKDLGRPVCRYSYNSESADGGTVEHGATVWFADAKGRICRGIVHYNIINMWWVQVGRYGVRNLGSHGIYVAQPANLRAKRNDRLRRTRLEKMLSAAIVAMDFERAALLRDITFGKQPTFLIWSRDKELFYAIDCRGYSSDSLRAGRFTREEAERECRRVPHILSMVMPDGSHVRFDREAA